MVLENKTGKPKERIEINNQQNTKTWKLIYANTWLEGIFSIAAYQSQDHHVVQKTGWIFHTERKKSEEVENHGHAWVLCKNETIRMDFIEELPSIFRFLFSVHSEDEVNSRNTAGKMWIDFK